MAGLIGFGINISLRGYWSGIKKPHLYFNFLVVIHAVNIFLNWVLIYGNLGAPALGTMGAGIATSISFYVGTLFYLPYGIITIRAKGFLRKKIKVSHLKKV